MDSSENYVSWKVIIRVINRYLTFAAILKNYTGDDNKMKIKKGTSLQIFCPFHDNKNTKAATLYKDDEGLESIWCYTESKRFFPYDLLKIYTDNKEIYTIFKKIWFQLTDEDRIYFINNEEIYIEKFDEDTIRLFNELDDFKNKKINYENVLKKICFFEERQR